MTLTAQHRCACFSFCSLRGTREALTHIPTRLPRDSPWAAYLASVYGSKFLLPPEGQPVPELERLQFVYAHGVPVANCSHGKKASQLCDRRTCAAWYSLELVQRPRVQGVEPYFGRGGSIFAFRWFWSEPSFVPDHTWLEVFRWKRSGEGHKSYGYWYVPAAGSGVWLNVGRSVSDPNKRSLALRLLSEYQQRFGPLPPSSEVTREAIDGGGSVPIAYVGRRLGFTSVQMVHQPSLSVELVACDALSLHEAQMQAHMMLRPLDIAPGGACGEAPLRSGQRAEAYCSCEAAAGFLHCSQIAFADRWVRHTARCSLIRHNELTRAAQCTPD